MTTAQRQTAQRQLQTQHSVHIGNNNNNNNNNNNGELLLAYGPPVSNSTLNQLWITFFVVF
jgi:hypothetical protein